VPRIIRDLPSFDHPSTLMVRGRPFRVKRQQIIIWVGIAEMGLPSLHPKTPRIPAIFDTGCNHSFVIHERHLREWAGIHPASLRPLGAVSDRGRRLMQFAANVWLHPNRPGYRDEFLNGQPFPLELPSGIAVASAESDAAWPRLPLLGTLGLRTARVRVTIDFEHARLSMCSPRRFWIFGG
jgi:hypothetical protein